MYSGDVMVGIDRGRVRFNVWVLGQVKLGHSLSTRFIGHAGKLLSTIQALLVRPSTSASWIGLQPGWLMELVA